MFVTLMQFCQPVASGCPGQTDVSAGYYRAVIGINGRSHRYLSSKDAYMLVYSRVAEDRGAPTSDITKLGDHQAATRLPDPPQRAKTAVSALNESHASACKAFEDRCDDYLSRSVQQSDSWHRKQATLLQFERARQTILNVVKSWSPTSRNEVCDCDGMLSVPLETEIAQDCAVVSRQGLETWVTRHLKAQPTIKPKADISACSQGTIVPTAAANEDIRSSAVTTDQHEEHAQERQGVAIISIPEVLCEHGRLDPNKAGDMKVITRVSRTGHDEE